MLSLYTSDKNRLFQDVSFLTSIYPYKNHSNPKSLQKAALYIKNEFGKTPLNVSSQYWQANHHTYENVVATFLPQKRKRLIIGAHYDTYKDSIGADDNASGVAAILEIARLLHVNQVELNYGIDLVAFCLEEPPYFKTKKMGSYIHAKSIDKTQQEVIGMFALEMIGYYRDKEERTANDKNFLFVSGLKDYDNFNRKVSYLLKENGSMNSRRIAYSKYYKNNGPSDHRNYWKFNYPAVMIIGSGMKKNPHYHKPSDTIDTLDFWVLSAAVDNIYHAAVNF